MLAAFFLGSEQKKNVQYFPFSIPHFGSLNINKKISGFNLPFPRLRRLKKQHNYGTIALS